MNAENSNLKNDVLKVALEKLKKELEKEPVISERVATLNETIRTLAGLIS